MNSGPANAVMGDADFGTSLPVTDVPEEVLEEEKKLAKYSQTAEFKRLRKFMEGRIEFFQTYLPDGRNINGGMDKLGSPVPMIDDQIVATYWRAANIVIGEFKAILAEYDLAKESVDGRSSS